MIGWRAVRRRLRSIALEDFRDIRESGLAPPVSIVVPAYNEGVTIIESVRSLLALRYPRLELVVVNDGSSDDTLDRLIAEFGLRRTPRVYWQRIKSKPVRGIYWSPAYPGLWVLDKVNGRKADATNAGINLASAPYVCVIDADSVLESDAMAAIMHAILPRSAETVAAGGSVRIANGCEFGGGAGVTRVGVPRTWLGAAQVIEYLRAFLYREGRLERARLPHARLRRLRRVPEGRAGGDRRLPARHRRRGHGPRGPDAPAHAGRRATLSHRLRVGPGVLDRVSGDSSRISAISASGGSAGWGRPWTTATRCWPVPGSAGSASGPCRTSWEWSTWGRCSR